MLIQQKKLEDERKRVGVGVKENVTEKEKGKVRPESPVDAEKGKVRKKATVRVP